MCRRPLQARGAVLLWGRVGRLGLVGSSCSLLCWSIDDPVDRAEDPRYPAGAARRELAVEVRAIVAVCRLGVRERWCLGVAAAHVLGEPLDAVGVVPFNAEVFAGDVPAGALAG